MQRFLCQEDGVVVELEVEQNPSQVEEKVRVVGGVEESLAETLDGLLRVSLDPPEVANLVEDRN